MGKRKNMQNVVQGFSSNPMDKALYDGAETDETDALFSALSDIRNGKPPAIVPVTDDGRLEFRGWQLTPVGLVPPTNADVESYKEIGRTLLRLDSSMQWLIGDWINTGDNFQWGETYNLIADEFGYEPKTLRQYAYVARNVEMSVRTDKLSFGHHERVASMEPEAQEHWLERAANEGLSISKMRAAIKESQLPAPNHDIDELNSKIPNGVTVEEIGTYNASEMGRMYDDLTEALTPQKLIRNGDIVRTRAGQIGTVEATEGRLAKVRVGNYATNHEVKSLQIVEELDEDATFTEPEPEPQTDDGFNHNAYRKHQDMWADARRAFEDVRSIDAARFTSGGKLGRSHRNRATNTIRDLIAHLHYIESQLQD